DICDEYSLDKTTVWKHVNYFALKLVRADNTRAVIKRIIANGLDLLDRDVLEIKPADIIGAAKHLDALEGRIQTKRKNEADLERKVQQYERAIENIIRRAKTQGWDINRDRALELLEGQFEDIRQIIGDGYENSA